MTKTALITGITDQDGSYLAEFCAKKDTRCPASSGALLSSTPSASITSTRALISIRERADIVSEITGFRGTDHNLKKVKEPCKKFGFTVGMLKGALAEWRKKK